MERTTSVSNLDPIANDAEIELARAEYESYAQQSLSKEAFLRSREIDKEIRRTKKSDASKQFKLLVLGAGDAGKSTLVRQLTMLHNPSSSASDIEHYRRALKDNALDAMKKLLGVCNDRGWEVPPEVSSLSQKILDAESFQSSLVPAIKQLWGSDVISRAWKKRSKSHVPSNAEYIFENIERIGAEDFKPTEDDILRSRSRTAGVVESRFESGGSEFLLIDVGGQRNERRKWAHFFDAVTAILFITALDEYDMVLEEDGDQNRMLEAMDLFKNVTKMSAFVNTTFILFLNKVDLFTKKIEERKKPLEKLFPDYSGGANAKAGASFILKKYEKAYGGKAKLFAHTTCALDKKNCDRVFTAVKETLIEQSMKLSGLSM